MRTRAPNQLPPHDLPDDDYDGDGYYHGAYVGALVGYRDERDIVAQLTPDADIDQLEWVRVTVDESA